MPKSYFVNPVHVVSISSSAGEDSCYVFTVIDGDENAGPWHVDCTASACAARIQNALDE